MHPQGGSPAKRGLGDSNLFQVQLPGFYCVIATSLDHKDNDHLVEYIAV